MENQNIASTKHGGHRPGSGSKGKLPIERIYPVTIYIKGTKIAGQEPISNGEILAQAMKGILIAENKLISKGILKKL